MPCTESADPIARRLTIVEPDVRTVASCLGACDINDPRYRDPPVPLEVHGPGQPKSRDALFVDLRQRAVPLLGVRAAVAEPFGGIRIRRAQGRVVEIMSSATRAKCGDAGENGENAEGS